jgi:hypothetical protein
VKRIKVPPKPTLEEAAKTFAKAWCEWHNDPDKMFSPEVVDAAHSICESIGLMVNEDPDTGVWELVRL